MKFIIRLFALYSAILSAGSAQAGYISNFPSAAITNDGVWAITATYAQSLGLPGATYIGSIGIRNTSVPFYVIGDTFDANSFLNSTNNASIIGLLNGTSPGVGYTGSEGMAKLGATTIRVSDQKLSNVAFFAFNTSDNITFNGSSTFNQSQSTGNFEPPPPSVVVANTTSPYRIPEPTTTALLSLGLAGLAFSRRKQ